METIFDQLITQLQDPRHIAVFPSEVTARAWLTYLLISPEQQEYRAIREDRIISWDHVKEQLFPRRDTRIPANRMYRMIFAQIISIENAKHPFLSYLIPRAYAVNSSSFIRTIMGLCPVLDEVKRQLSYSTSFVTLSEDITLLDEKYHTFLDKHGLFEPSFELELLDRSQAEAVGKRYTLYFPAVMKDYRQLQPQLDTAPFVTTRSVTAVDFAVPMLHLYQNSSIEIAGSLSYVEDLLQNDVPAEQIVLTLADYTSMYTDLAHQARLRGIPLQFRSGRPLTDFPVSGLFRDIHQVVREQFSLSSMKRLLLQRSYPWKDRKANQKLIQAGIKASCLKNYVNEQGKEVDVWVQRLRRQKDDSLLAHYKLVKESCRVLVSSADMKRLWRNLHTFQHTLLIPYVQDHNDEASAVFSYCIDQLQKLVDVSKRLTLPEGFPVYAAWLTMLESVWYVPQQPASGISVYPYGVSAGIPAACHMLIGMDQAHTAMIDDPYVIFSDQQRKQLGLTPYDMTSELLTVYLHSGRQIRCSCSRKTRSGQQIPASLFVEHDMIREEEGDIYPGDPFKEELRYWEGGQNGSPFPRRIYPVQLRGFTAADKSVLQKKQLDLSRKSAPSKQFSARFFDDIRDAQGNIVISPTSLDRFMGCPFSWFITYGLRVGEEQFESEYTDARSQGILIHSCYERFFSWIEDHEGGVFSSKHIDRYQEELGLIIDEELDRYHRRFDAPADAAFYGVAHYLIEKLPALLENEVKILDGWKVESLECKISLADPEKQYMLEGRIDRVCRHGPGRDVAIIDYKKNNWVKVSSFGPDSERPGSYQLPFYTYLIEMEHPGTTEVVYALYYDVTKGKYVKILPCTKGKLQIDRDRFDEVIHSMLSDIQLMTHRIKHAAVQIPPGAGSQCGSCQFRDICRGRFTIR